MLDLETDGEIIGYVWVFPEINNVWSIHMVVHPDHQGRWASRRVLDELWQIFYLPGMRSCIAFCSTPAIARIWQRLGFIYVQGAGIAYLDVDKERKNNELLLQNLQADR